MGAGMVMAADLSSRLGMISKAEGLRLKRLIERAALPTAPPQKLDNSMQELMARDKKATDKGLRFVLLNKLGEACLIDNVDESALRSTLKAGAGMLETN